MKVITAPAVRIISGQEFRWDRFDEFLAEHNVGWETDTGVPAEILGEAAGRLCYFSFANPRPGGNWGYLRHIKEVGHGSVLEHAVWTFLLTGVSRSLSHELVRHRAGWAYSQLSQRYVDESVAEYVEPEVIARDPELHAVWLDAVAHAHEAYVKLVDLMFQKRGVKWWCPKCLSEAGFASGFCPKCGDATAKIKADNPTEIRKAIRQAARSVLPNATETKITVTANARALRHFLEQRGSVYAEPEIRALANAMYKLLVVEAPNLFGDYELRALPDGTFEITTRYDKV